MLDKKRKYKCFSKAGQMTLEMVLILAFLISVSYLTLNQLNQFKPVYEFVSKPWKTIAGMIESGSWRTKERARRLHPSHYDRVSAIQGENPI